MARLKLDGHVHSKFSGDPYLKWSTPQRIVDQAFWEGLDLLIVTDTNKDVFVDSEELKKFGIHEGGEGKWYIDHLRNPYHIPESPGVTVKKGLTLLRGVELHDEKGHLLIWGNKKKFIFNPKYNLKDRIRQARDLDAKVGIPHPFVSELGAMTEAQIDEFIEYVDFMECINANSLWGLAYEKKVRDYALKNRKAVVGNSDAHRVKDLARAYTLFEEQDNLEAREKLFRCIDNQSTVPGGSYLGKLDTLDWMILRRIVSGDWRGLRGLVKPFIKSISRK